MSAEFSIRSPEPDDVEALAQLHIATWQQTYAHLVPESFFSERMLEFRRAQWKKWVTEPEPGQSTRIAEIAGSIVGFAMAGRPQKLPAPRETQVHMMYLDASAQGSGAGQALLEAVLPPGPAFLVVARDNPRAQAFYRRNGFVPDGHESTDERAPLLVEARWVRG